MGTSLDGETRRFTRVYVIYSADVLGSDRDIDCMGPDRHMAAGYPEDSGNFRAMTACAAKFVLTEGNEQYDYGYFADESGQDRYRAAVDMPGDYEGDGYQGRHRKWIGELSREEWLLFAHAYLIDLDNRGFPVDYDDTIGSVTEHGRLEAVSVSNREGWDSPGFYDSVIDSAFYVSFGSDET